MKRPVYKCIASLLQARINCILSDNDSKDADGNSWQNNHEDKLHEIEKNYLPHGSGIDSGCTIELFEDEDTERIDTSKFTINSSCHLMDDNGFYCGWLDFKVVVEPCLINDFTLNIKGRFSGNKYAYGLREYLYDLFDIALRQEIEL